MKKIFSRIIAILLTLTILLSAPAAAEFTDVPSTQWYASDVNYVTSLGLFTGTGDGVFSPAANMTRAMFVTVLGRYANVDVKTIPAAGLITKTDVNMRSQPNTDSTVLASLSLGARVDVLGLADGWYNIRYGGKTGYVRSDLMSASDTKFTDIGYGTYYGAYVQWAQSLGIISGTSQTAFSPNSNILREQICAVLYNYSVAAGVLLPAGTEKATFTDDGLISDYAKTAVYAMQQAGVVEGYSNGSFIPNGSATRAEVAAIMSRFISVAGESGTNPGPVEEPYQGYLLFGNFVPETVSVSDSYFDDACFIGHSLVDGMKKYFSLPKADFFAVNGISANGLLKYDQFPLSTTYENEDGETVNHTGTIAEAISEKSYGKVYIMLGVNELGPETYHVNTFYNSLCSLIDIVRSKQPAAKIYLISILPVSRSCSLGSDNYNRANVLAFNSRMMQASSDKGVFYIDAFGEYIDANGYLPESSCMSDGIHILSFEYARLKTILKTHTA